MTMFAMSGRRGIFTLCGGGDERDADFNNLLYRLTGVRGAELYAGVLALVLGAAFRFLALKYMHTSDEI